MTKKPAEKEHVSDEAAQLIVPKIYRYFRAVRSALGSLPPPVAAALVIFLGLCLILYLSYKLVSFGASHFPDFKVGLVRMVVKIEDQLKEKEVRDVFLSQMEEGLKDLVAYSYVVEFRLDSESKKSYALTYIGSKDSTGKISCWATYPKAGMNAYIHFFPSSERERELATIAPRKDKPESGMAPIEIKKNDLRLFTPEPPQGDYPKIDIQVDDSPPFTGGIWVDCVVMINGPHTRPSL